MTVDIGRIHSVQLNSRLLNKWKSFANLLTHTRTSSSIQWSVDNNKQYLLHSTTYLPIESTDPRSRFTDNNNKPHVIQRAWARGCVVKQFNWKPGPRSDHIKTTTPDRATTIKRHLNNTNDCYYRIEIVISWRRPLANNKCDGIGRRALDIDIEIYWPTLRKQAKNETELCQSILNKCQPACLRPLHILDSCIECRQVQFIVVLVSLAYDADDPLRGWMTGQPDGKQGGWNSIFFFYNLMSNVGPWIIQKKSCGIIWPLQMRLRCSMKGTSGG